MDDRNEADTDEAAFGRSMISGGGVTLRRLQIFIVVAYCETLTKAAKQLGLAQPSLSQQLSALEQALGMQLFDRRSNRMELTGEGHKALALAERVLNSMQALEDGVRAIGSGARQTIRVAGLSSVLRVLLPPALETMPGATTGLDFDIHESAPGDVLDLLYGRHVSLGLVASESIEAPPPGFQMVPIMTDPLVLAVPGHLDLAGMRDPDKELCADDLALLHRTVQFVFGTHTGDGVREWWGRALPRSRMLAQVRSYESALALVQQGLGICVVPALATKLGGRVAENVRLYRTGLEPRHIVAVLPSQYLHNPTYSALIEALRRAAGRLAGAPLHDCPPFIRAVL